MDNKLAVFVVTKMGFQDEPDGNFYFKPMK